MEDEIAELKLRVEKLESQQITLSEIIEALDEDGAVYVVGQDHTQTPQPDSAGGQSGSSNGSASSSGGSGSSGSGGSSSASLSDVVNKLDAINNTLQDIEKNI